MKKYDKKNYYEKLAEKIFAGILILAVAGGLILSLTDYRTTAAKAQETPSPAATAGTTDFKK